MVLKKILKHQEMFVTKVQKIAVIELGSVADRCAYATTKSAFLVVRPAGEDRRCC